MCRKAGVLVPDDGRGMEQARTEKAKKRDGISLEMYCSAFLLKPVSSRKLKKAFENLRRPILNVSQDLLEEHFSGEKVIGKRIEMYRKKRGLSAQDLADLMKVSRQSVYRWENGERIPDVLTFMKLARMIGVRVESLLGL